MEKHPSFSVLTIEKQQSFRVSAMKKQNRFRIAMGRKMSFGVDRKKTKVSSCF